MAASPIKLSLPRFAALPALLTFAVASSQAQDTHTWNDPNGGVWGTFTKWTPIGIPSSLDTARFNFSTTDPVPISLIQGRAVDELLISDGEIAFEGSGIPTGDRVLSAQNSRIQQAGHLVLQQRETGLIRDLNFAVNNQLEVNGEMSIRDGSLVTSDRSIVDHRQDALVTVSGMSANGRASRWDSGGLTVGQNEQGSLLIENGGQVTSDWANIAEDRSSDAEFIDATVQVSGLGPEGSPSSWTVAGQVTVGGATGRGRLRIQDGAFASSGSTTVRPGSDIEVEGVDAAGNPSRWNTGTQLTVTSGDVLIKDGAVVTSEQATIRRFGDVRVRGSHAGNPSTWNTSGLLSLGNDDRGDLLIQSGGRVFSDTTEIAAGTANASDSIVFLSRNNAPTTTTWTNSGNVYVGGSATTTGSAAKVFVNDGTLADIGGTVKIWGPGVVDMDGGVLSADVIDNDEGGTFDFLGGTLQVNQFNGDLLNQGGTLAPGPAAGATTISGDYTQQSTGVLALDIGGTGAGGTHDLLNIGGEAALDGLLQLTLINGFMPNTSDEFTVLAADGILGLFDNVSTGQRVTTTGGDGSFVVNYGIGSAFDEDRVVLSDFMALVVLAGDYNGSGQVEQGDLDLVLQNWGDDTDVAGLPAAWINDNANVGQIEQTELDRVLQNWGSTAAPDFRGSAVPEPASLALLALGTLALMPRRRVRH